MRSRLAIAALAAAAATPALAQDIQDVTPERPEEQVRRARRSLFGLRLPDLGIFGDDDDEGEDSAAIREITSTIASFYTGADGRMAFVLADGSVWVQTDGRRQRPRRGEPIRVRRGPLGSYIASIDERAGVHVVRQR